MTQERRWPKTRAVLPMVTLNLFLINMTHAQTPTTNAHDGVSEGLVVNTTAGGPTWPGALNYKWNIVAQSNQSTAAGTIGSLGSQPSVNGAGYVAFIGHIVSGTTVAGDAVFFGNGLTSAPTQLNVGFVASNRSFGQAVEINNKGSVAPMGNVLAWDQVAGAPQYYYERIWQGTAPGSFTIAAKGALSVSGYPFGAVFAQAAFNDSESVVFSGLDQNLNSILGITNASPPPSFFTLDLNTPLRPAIDSNGNTVVQAGNQSTSPIALSPPDFKAPTYIATSSEFSVLGMSPGISRDGLVVAFYGEDSNGPGVFINVPSGTGGQTNMRIAGNPSNPELGTDSSGNNIYFLPSGFVPSMKVGVTDFESGASGIAGNTILVTFVGTPSEQSISNPNASVPFSFTAAQGLWTVRIDVTAVGSDFLYVQQPASTVIQMGDMLNGAPITGISLFDPMANMSVDDSGNPHDVAGDHRLALWASTSTSQLMLRGTHTSLNSMDISKYSRAVSTADYQTFMAAGGQSVAVQAWGGLSENSLANQQLQTAQGSGLGTAAYALLNFLTYGGTGAAQVDNAVNAVGTALTNLKFIVVDAEQPPCCVSTKQWQANHQYKKGTLIVDSNGNMEYAAGGGKSGPKTPTWASGGLTTKDGTVTWKDLGVLITSTSNRIAVIRSAVSQITSTYHLAAVIYTDRGSWNTITGGCGSGASPNCADLIALPLWDIEHTHYTGSDGNMYCGDGVQGLGFFKAYPNSAWTFRSGNQYNFGVYTAAADLDESDLTPSSMRDYPAMGDVAPAASACTAQPLFGIASVDLDFFDPTLFQ
jgi:hypothetical protein